MFQAEDYQALFNELGGTEPATNNNTVPTVPADPAPVTDPENNNTNPTPVADPTAAQDSNSPAAAAPESNDGGSANPTDADDESQKQARAFAEMRSTIGKYQKVFKQLQPMMGLNSEDEVIERLLNTGLNIQAQKQNIDPTILKRLNKLEEENLTMLNEQKQKAVIESFGLLQKDFNLTNEEAMAFARELDAKNVDIFKIGVDLSTLYRGMHHKDIVAKEINAAKQAWIAEGNAANSAPGVTTVTGKKNNQGKTEINTMGELENLFNSLKK